MNITKETVIAAIKGAYAAYCEVAGKKIDVSLKLCSSIANKLYMGFGISVTTLFVEEVLLIN